MPGYMVHVTSLRVLELLRTPCNLMKVHRQTLHKPPPSPGAIRYYHQKLLDPALTVVPPAISMLLLKVYGSLCHNIVKIQR